MEELALEGAELAQVETFLVTYLPLRLLLLIHQLVLLEELGNS
nr:MAG TPA: hypothetical protein [Caudoviricetes sp.]